MRGAAQLGSGHRRDHQGQRRAQPDQHESPQPDPPQAARRHLDGKENDLHSTFIRRARRRTRGGRRRRGQRCLAQADELHREAQVGLDGEHDAALGRAVELGEHHARHLDRLGELPRLGQAVLPGRGVDDEQHLAHVPGRPVGHPPHLAQLLHQVDLGVEATGGVGQHEVVLRAPRPAGRRRRSPSWGRHPRLPRTMSAPARSAHGSSCSAAAARKVSPAAMTTEWPSAT